MANLQQDRVPAGTLASSREPGSPPSTASHPANLSLVSVRIDSPDHVLAMSLATDLIRASGGAPQTGEPGALSASFPNLTLAVLIGRRLQWALQGLADPEPIPGTASTVPAAAAISIQSAAEAAAAHAQPAATSGQILLSPDAAAAVRQLPGIELRDSRFGCCELLWQHGFQPLTYDSDEQALLRLIRDCGREDPCHGKIETASRPLPVAPTLGRSDRPETGTPSLLERVGPAPKLWFILGGVAAAILLVIALAVFAKQHGASRAAASVPPTPVADSPSVSPSSPAGTGGTGSVAPAAPTHAPANPNPPVPRIEKPRPTVIKKTSSPDLKFRKPVDNSACDFTDTGIQSALLHAETEMKNGRLEVAKNAFLRLRDCSSARDRAEQGLRTVQRKIDAQALSHPD